MNGDYNAAHNNRAVGRHGGDAVTERVSVGNERYQFFFFFIITAFCAALQVPLHRRISDVKHVASWVLGL